jgi:hypothetical protein
MNFRLLFVLLLLSIANAHALHESQRDQAFYALAVEDVYKLTMTKHYTYRQYSSLYAAKTAEQEYAKLQHYPKQLLHTENDKHLDKAYRPYKDSKESLVLDRIWSCVAGSYGLLVTGFGFYTNANIRVSCIGLGISAFGICSYRNDKNKYLKYAHVYHKKKRDHARRAQIINALCGNPDKLSDQSK